MKIWSGPQKPAFCDAGEGALDLTWRIVALIFVLLLNVVVRLKVD